MGFISYVEGRSFRNIPSVDLGITVVRWHVSMVAGSFFWFLRSLLGPFLSPSIYVCPGSGDIYTFINRQCFLLKDPLD
jgi:hypothetical protein